MISQRFNPDNDWLNENKKNYFFTGFTGMINKLVHLIPKDSTMIEIGSYMGESTMMLASSKLFKKIYAIEPHKGTESFNDYAGYDWEFVKKEFHLNTRYFDNITLISDFNYNVVDMFEDESIDFIYIDADHEYDSVKRDIELYLPKLKKTGIIGGHDYSKNAWEGVFNAVNETLGEPDYTFEDMSWLKRPKTSKI